MLWATPSSGARIHRPPSSVCGPGNAESATTAIATYIVTTVAMPPNTRARQVDAGAPRLRRKVGHRLEAREGEHRERQREGERMPGRMRAERRAVRQSVRREDEREAEDDEQQLGQQIEGRHDDADAVERRTPHEPQQRDGGDHGNRDDDIPRVAVERGRRRARRRGSAAGRAPRGRSRSGSRGRAPSR